MDKAKLAVILNYYDAKYFNDEIANCDSFINKYSYSGLIPTVFSIKASSQNFIREHLAAKKTLGTLIANFPKSKEYPSAIVQLGYTEYKLGNYSYAIMILDEAINNYYQKIDTSET